MSWKEDDSLEYRIPRSNVAVLSSNLVQQRETSAEGEENMEEEENHEGSLSSLGAPGPPESRSTMQESFNIQIPSVEEGRHQSVVFDQEAVPIVFTTQVLPDESGSSEPIQSSERRDPHSPLQLESSNGLRRRSHPQQESQEENHSNHPSNSNLSRSPSCPPTNTSNFRTTSSAPEAAIDRDEGGCLDAGRQRKLILFFVFAVCLLLLALVVLVAVFLAQNHADKEQQQESGVEPHNTNNKMGANATTSHPTEPPSTAPAAKPITNNSTLERIRERGTLLCGVIEQDGFCKRDDTTGNYTGFEVDLCRAVAAAVFGSPDKVTFVLQQVSTGRFIGLHNESVDLLASQVTHTMERDIMEPTTNVGYTFSIPYLYNGLGFGGLPQYVACASNLTNCDGMIICVLDGSTHVGILKTLLPDAARKTPTSRDGFYSSFVSNDCNVLAGEQFEISRKAVMDQGYQGEYDTSSLLYSKEPISLVTRDGDREWSDFVNWVIEALLSAEEDGRNITQSTARSFVVNSTFGDQYANMFQDAVTAVGNYGEMYQRHLEEYVPRLNANRINTGETGLIISMPFGNLTVAGPEPNIDSTLRIIRDRGHLKCGISRRGFFATFDGDEYTGFDVDFCKALSAAIFGGITSTIDYVNLPAAVRFQKLRDGEVDVLARMTTHTLERDVSEETTGLGFAFSQPIFYDGLSYGGEPFFQHCAEEQLTSQNCSSLKICVSPSTTYQQELSAFFGVQYQVSDSSWSQVSDGFMKEQCNVIAGGVADVAFQANTTEYEVGTKQFSKDPLALVTREDDPQWSSFVYWIVSAVMYAEEEGFSNSDASSMPLVHLFGPLYWNMFRDAVQVVGSYGGIYERNIEAFYERSGRELLNTQMEGPQHYPLPGIEWRKVDLE